MNFQEILKKTERLITHNSPAILTAIGVTGTVTTAYLTGTASFKAAEILKSEQARRDLQGRPQPIKKREQAEIVWKVYVPPVAIGAVTIAAIIFANRIGTRRAAAMAAAYTLTERAYTEYKEKVVETIGKNKEQALRDSLAEDRVRKNPPGDSEVIIAGSGDVLCHDSFSGRYFNSNMEALRRAVNDINYQILHSDFATVTDFYNKIGLAQTTMSEDLGWNTDKKLELSYSSILTEDGRPCLSIDFASVPMPQPWRFV